MGRSYFALEKGRLEIPFAPYPSRAGEFWRETKCFVFYETLQSTKFCRERERERERES